MFDEAMLWEVAKLKSAASIASTSKSNKVCKALMIIPESEPTLSQNVNKDTTTRCQDMIASCSLMNRKTDGSTNRRLSVCEKNNSDRDLVCKTLKNYRKALVVTQYV